MSHSKMQKSSTAHSVKSRLTEKRRKIYGNQHIYIIPGEQKKHFSRTEYIVMADEFFSLSL